MMFGPVPGFAAAAAPVFQWQSNARLRTEWVEDDAFASSADATTLRERLGLSFKPDAAFAALVEVEAIAAAGARNDGTNGRADRPGIVDPAGVELNQAWASWHRDAWTVVAGRQRLLWDNQRWVGNSGWRQNEQTFDAVSAQWSPSAALAFGYIGLDRVHRVNGDDARDPLARERDLASHGFDVAYAAGRHRWRSFVLAHEDRDAAAASTLTAGVRWALLVPEGEGGFGMRAELARQRDHADNPVAFSHAYRLAELSLARAGVTWRLGWEHLGGNGRHALQAPLGTLHAFNGWADRFLVTPAGGLDDRYVGAGGAFDAGLSAPVNWTLAWHDYGADTGGAGYGREWNASIGIPLARGLNALVKAADYRGDGFLADTAKLWVQLEWVY